MLQARMLGNYAGQKAAALGYSYSDIGRILNCSESKVKSFLKGRAFLSFEQLNTLAVMLDVSVPEMLKGDIDTYNQTVVHCMNDFDDIQNREMILDIIDDYVDISDSIKE